MEGVSDAAVADLVMRAYEIGHRRGEQPSGCRIRSSADVRNLMRVRMVDLEVEHFVALSLDARHRVVREHWITKGTSTSCSVSVADTFRELVRCAAPYVIFVHNHPSGDPAPSSDDITLTSRLSAAGELMGIRVLDHVILGREGHSSLDELGKLGLDRATTGRVEQLRGAIW